MTETLGWLWPETHAHNIIIHTHTRVACRIFFVGEGNFEDDF